MATEERRKIFVEEAEQQLSGNQTLLTKHLHTGPGDLIKTLAPHTPSELALYFVYTL